MAIPRRSLHFQVHIYMNIYNVNMPRLATIKCVVLGLIALTNFNMAMVYLLFDTRRKTYLDAFMQNTKTIY